MQLGLTGGRGEFLDLVVLDDDVKVLQVSHTRCDVFLHGVFEVLTV